MPHHRAFPAPLGTGEFVLFRNGRDRRLIARDEAIRSTRREPELFRWYRAQRVSVVLANGTRETRRVPVLRKLTPDERPTADKPLRISIPRFTQPRTHRIGGRGRLVHGGNPQLPNALDRLVDAMAGGDLSLAEDFRRAWSTIQMRFKYNPEDKDETPETYSFAMFRTHVPYDLTMETADRSILYFPKADKSTKSETRARQ